MHGGFGQSPALLIAEYVARVEHSELDRLRALCDAQPRSADRLLALDVARYLMDAGIVPLLVPAGRALPHAALDTTSPKYLLDARLYRTANPGALVRRTYRQLWANLRRTSAQRCTGAFLVMFCRRGRLIELPFELEHDGLIIYSVTIDLAEVGEQPDRPVTIQFFDSSRPIPR